MTLRKPAVVVTCALVVLLLLACGPASIFGGGDEATATPTQAPPATATPVPESPTATPPGISPTEPAAAEATATTAAAVAPTAVTEVEVPSMASLEGVDSYSAVMDLRITSIEDGTLLMNVTINFEVDRVNNAQRMSMSGMEESGEETSIHMVTIGSDSWMSFGEGWMHTKADEAGSVDSMASDFLMMGEETLNSIEEPRLVQRGETVNGMVTDRYAFDETSFRGWEGELDISEAEGELWITQDGRYVVKLVMHAEGDVMGEEEEQAVLDMIWELLSLNQPLSIQPPEEFAAEETIPIMEGALSSSGYFVSSEMAMYEVKATDEEVLQWYEDTLTAAGWTQDSEDLMEGMSSASYSKDDESLSVMVLPSETEGAVSVMVTKG
ncbi:MAG: hypothetical protein HPY83_03300 [Anaerolineae bacterium]|nr:hypothetical protein [Anaerolineae bacterium]